MGFSVSPTWNVQECCLPQPVTPSCTAPLAGTSNWTLPLDLPLFPCIPSFQLALHHYSVTYLLQLPSACFFSLTRIHREEQKSTHVSCPSLHLLLGVQWQIPVLLCANVTALFTADLRVYIRPQCYLPVFLILSAGNPSDAVGVAAPVLKEFVSISAGTNPPCTKPLCSICSNWNFDKDILSTSTRTDRLFFFRCTWR